jgi:succinate dehydrogenase / fumarate reductase iron-sulfur subunit
MTQQQQVTLRVQRFHPGNDTGPKWVEFPVEVQPGMTVLDGLLQIRRKLDATLAWRYSCRMGLCGSCGMMINGKPGLACNTQIHDVCRDTLRLAPLANFPVIRDLVPDLRPMFAAHAGLRPYLVKPDTTGTERGAAESRQTPEELTQYLQFSYCIKCGVCMAACPTVAQGAGFLGPMPLTAAHRYNADSRDQGFELRKPQLANARGARHCHFAGECTRVCPKGVDPARAIQLIRRDLLMDLFHLKARQTAAPHVPAAAVPEATPPIRPPPFSVDRD